jgi:menaquinone-specific isochorismate synthase
VTIPRRLARTRRLDRDVDLLDVIDADGALFSHPARGLAGRGVAATITIDRGRPLEAAATVQNFFATIDRDDEVGLPGCGPVAMGALPFVPAEPAQLVVPRVVVGHAADGTRWITTVTLPDEDPDAVAERADFDDARSGVAPPSMFTIEPEMNPAAWCDIVEQATKRLAEGDHLKVVLARAVQVRGDQPLDPTGVLRRLRHAYPGCYLFAGNGFVGASPELLVSRFGDIVRCHPMAGTAPRSADPSTDARLAASLLASAKDREEHQITIDMVHDTLLPWCSYLDWEPEPSIVAVANVQHLATRMEGRLSEPAASVVELMAALHPTPAVGGHPREAALAMIDELEQLDRSCYGGPVGWVDADGNGEWAVGIRSAHIEGAVARCFAGVGVVADSDPVAELAETRVKLQALLSALVQP